LRHASIFSQHEPRELCKNIRAAKSVAKRHPNFEWWRSEHLGGTLIFFLADNVMSYAMARLKADFL
jgi:hypothetical protein